MAMSLFMEQTQLIRIRKLEICLRSFHSSNQVCIRFLIALGFKKILSNYGLNESGEVVLLE